MRRYGSSLLFFAVVTTLWLSTAYAAEREMLPDLTLPLPASAEHRTYLELGGQDGETFRLNDIGTDYLLIELFSMYCPFCQEEAPAINELYELMETLPEDGPSVKIIGLGAGNSQFEVDHFRKTYDIRFPLFPDPDLAMYKAMQGAGTPGFVGSKKDEQRGFVIVLRQSGGFYDKEVFLKRLLNPESGTSVPE